MSTRKYILTAAITLAICGPAAAENTARNFTASSNYWAWVDAMQAPADLTMPKEADVGRGNPLHPAYYAGKARDAEGSNAKANAKLQLSEIRNPLHPQYYLR